MDFLKSYIPNIHKEGIFFIVIGLLTALLLSVISSKLSVVAIFVTIFIIFFFRDPQRIIPISENLIISPADGVITKVEEAILPKTLGFDGIKKTTKISIFLNVFNVHVNRIPADGKIKAMHYHQGQFVNASFDKSSELNERQEVLMKMKNGAEIVFTQIAGFIARRIVCNLEEGQNVDAGSRFGIIRFGSRMDVYLPEGVKPLVSEGQTSIGGETILADIKAKNGLTFEAK